MYRFTPEGSKTGYKLVTYEGRDGREYIVTYYSTRNKKQTKKLSENSRTSHHFKNGDATDHFQTPFNISPEQKNVKPEDEKNGNFPGSRLAFDGCAGTGSTPPSDSPIRLSPAVSSAKIRARETGRTPKHGGTSKATGHIRTTSPAGTGKLTIFYFADN